MPWYELMFIVIVVLIIALVGICAFLEICIRFNIIERPEEDIDSNSEDS